MYGHFRSLELSVAVNFGQIFGLPENNQEV